jgi:uncharacterized RDD family membrane protein YckC
MTTIKTQSYLGQRIAATIIDYFIIFAVSVVFVTAFGERDEEGSRSVDGPMALMPELFWFCWLIVAEAVWGRTFGHYAVGLKIVTIEGNKPQFWQALVRRLFDMIDLFTCFPGLVAFILVQKTKLNQLLGRIVAKTLVVHKNFELQETAFDFEKPVQNQ